MDPLWISDDILNDALSRFTLFKSSRRHGSSIPGPLEARRRATKRRVMNLVSPPAGAVIDPGFFDPDFLPCINPGLNSTGRQWQASSRPASQEPVAQVEDVTPLPPWLTDTQPTEVIEDQPCSGEERPSSTKEILNVEKNPETKQFAPPSYKARGLRKQFAPPSYKARGLRSTLSGQKTLESTQSTRTFLNGLKNCKVPEDIQKLAAELNIQLRSAPMCSKLAFDHMLRLGSKLGVLIQFLECSNLDALEARNLNTLLQWHLKQEVNEDDKRLLHLWIRRQVSQGAWRAKELSLLLESVFRINGMIESENSDCSFSQTIFQGLSSSTVFTIHDVEGSALNVLLGSVTSSSLSENGELLGIEIIKHSSTLQLRKMESSITVFLKKCLLRKNRHQKVLNFNRKIATKLLELLQRAPVHIQVKSIAGATSALLMCREYASPSRSALLKNLKTWWYLLLKHGMFKFLGGNDQWVEVERILARQNVDILATYLLPLNDEEKCCFLLRNWFIPDIGSEPTCQLGKAQHIEKEFRRELTLPRARLPHFVTMLHTLGSNLQFNSRWISPLFLLLRELGRSSTVLEIVSFSQILGLRISSISIVHEISESAKSNPHMAYRLFKATPNIPLEACPVVAEIMIQNPRFNPSTALLYRQNRQRFLSDLNLFLQPEPGNIFRKCKFPWEKSLERRKHRAYLLHHMALAYAQALHLYPRVAFRSVYECYRLHKNYRLGPVSVDMSRALTIAGVVRPLQEGNWLSTMKFRWILNVVNEVEGEEIARGIDELGYKWRTEVLRTMRIRKAREQQQERMGLVVPRPVRKRLRGKTLAIWMAGRKAGERARGAVDS